MGNKMETNNGPIIVDFPLRGEWTALNTPGHKIPSHGTDQLGQRFAYDFMQIDWAAPKEYKFFSRSKFSYYMKGVPLRECLGWSQPFFAPFQGEVVEAADGHKERDPVHLIRDLFIVIKNAFTLSGKNNNDLIPAVGNYIIIKGENDIYAFFAHARNGSIKVKKGDKVETGRQLGQVGHSGNSTAPHLHFHLMDRQELLDAKGISCCFRNYERYTESGWEKEEKGIPKFRERIRLT
jgi:hypothetical protein